MSGASTVACDREQKVRRQNLRRPGRLGEPVCTLHGTFERTGWFRVDDANRAQQIALLHPEL
jgi:hypothetical protein